MMWLEIVGALVGLVYLWLEYRASVWLWAANIVMPAIYIWVYAEAGFYADSAINVYFLVASVYGWLMWLRKGDGGRELPISRTPRRSIPALTAVGVIAWGAIAYVLQNYTDSIVVWGDSFTTAFSIVALYMLSRKWTEQWLVWLVVDAVSCGLYIYKGLYPTAVLYGLYTVLAWVGYRRWIEMMKQDENTEVALRK